MKLYEILKVDKDHLVQKVFNFKQDEIKYPCIVQEKYDGVFCFAIKLNDEVRIFSRVGNEYLSLEHLKKPLLTALNNSYGRSIILFEAYIEGAGQEVISGFCRDTQEQHPEIKAVLFDCLSLSEYYGTNPTSYAARWQIVREIYSVEYSSKFILPTTITALEWSNIHNFVERIWLYNGEGVVIKNPKSAYQRGKRNAQMMKLKRGVSYDLEVVNVVEGTGKYVGMLGKLVCKFKDTTITVGSGLVDSERKRYWQDKSLIIGKIVQVNAMKVSKNGVLREPTFKGIRYDKECADY